MTPEERERRIEALVEEASFADDDVVAGIAEELLELDPESPHALLLLAEQRDLSEEGGEARALLERAAAELRRRIGEEPDLNDSLGGLLAVVLERLCFSALMAGDNEKVLAVAEELVSFDPDDETLGRTLLYRSLMVLDRHREVLERSLAEEEEDVLFALHGRALALFLLSGPGPEASRALWDAIALEPDLPYYLLQYWEVPDEGSDDEEEIYAWETCNLAGLLSEAWLADEDRMGWFATAAILFGYLTDRLPDQIIEQARPHMEQAGLLAVLEMVQSQMEALLQAEEETSLEDVDAMAIRLLREMSELSVEG